MQAIAPVTFADLLSPVQRMRHKVEIYDTEHYRTDFLSGWSFRKRIDIQTAFLGANLTAFQLYVPINAGADIGAICRADGYDVRFTAADGMTALPFEREKGFAVAGGLATGIFWVLCDPAMAGTHIWCYYGNASAADVSAPATVWASYRAVWHMNDATTSTILDSTGNNNGAKQAANHPIEATGKLGKCQQFGGTPDYIDVGNGASLQFGTGGFTLEGWQKQGAYSPMFEKRGVGGWIFTLDVSPWGTRSWLGINGNYWGFNLGGLIAGAWGHIVLVIDRAAFLAHLYVNGQFVESKDISAAAGSSDSAQNLWLGKSVDPVYLVGYQDEMRISSGIRTAEWIAFEYRNMAEADNELTWGAEQTPVLIAAAWLDLHNLAGEDYLKSVSLSLGGAGMETAPIAGTWSAVIDNPLGIFHPKHPTSPYAGLLRVGREVRISVGANYGVSPGVDYYWQRLIGFMDAPRFNHGERTVEIGGLDYTKLLADTNLLDVNPIAESGVGSGSFGADDVINGPLHWGRRAVFDAVPSPGGSGPELYDEADACEIGAGEANNVASWALGGSGGIVSSVAGTKSLFALQFERDAPGPTEQYAHDPSIFSVTAGNQYRVSFWGRIAAGENYALLNAYQTVGGAAQLIGQQSIGVSDNVWVPYSFMVTATTTGAMQLRVSTKGKYAAAGDIVRVDEVSIQLYDLTTWMRYDLPAECNGPWLVTIAGVPIGQGDQEEGGWHYFEDGHYLNFNPGMVIQGGTDSINIFYYTNQVPENVLADILVRMKYYATRAAALADMDYVPTGVILSRVWFDAASSPNSVASSFAAIQAVTKLCERVNYRFWFDYAGRPCFLPAPVADAVDFTFPEPGDLRSLSEYQDEGMVRNHVVIEGCDRVMYQVGKDDKANDKYKGEAVDPAVTAGTVLEKTYPISNHLFQTQSSINYMCALLLSEGKDPKWYADLTLFANPIPLELGDVVEWPAELEPTPAADVDSGNLVVSMMGIIRDIKINNAEANYKVEIADEFWSAGMLPSGSASPSGSVPPGPVSGLPSGSPSGILEVETFDFGTEADEDLAWVVPTGVTFIEAEAWGPGGIGGAAGVPGSDLGGGGGGGGAYSKDLIAVTPGETLDLHFPADGPDNAEIYRGASCLLRAQHGIDGNDMDGSSGGPAAAGIGDTRFSGGRGADVSAVAGGGGGSSAGTAADGNDAAGINGASAPAGGAAGGDGGVEDANGNDGATPGGGGGGAGYNWAGGTTPGAGGYGRIRISYWN